MFRFLRRALPFLTAAVLVAGIYDGWIFYSRWRDRRDIENRRQERETEDARRTIDALGGGELRILDFYATPGVIRRGEQARLCYGVFGAKAVRLNPPVEQIDPAVSHCLDVSPAKSTQYTLTATDAAGHTTTRQLVLRVE